MSHNSHHGGPTDQQQILPAPPRAPWDAEGITPDYLNQLTRWLENFARLMTGTPHLSLSGLYFPPGSLATTGYGLKPGEVFANDGILTVVQEGDIWAGGFAVSVGLGSVTVTVS